MNSQEISKSDWKLFRERIATWQENYMDKLTKEYIVLLSGNENASKKFWTLEKRIKNDKKHPGVLIELRKSTMIYDIVALLRDEVIGYNDLDGFSEELRERVQFIAQRW